MQSASMTEPEIGPSKLLFICTGNYYRSRFAEILFNSLAREAELDWIAESRGIATERVVGPAPISNDTVRGLEARGLGGARDYRHPEQLRERDLTSAQLVVAINEREHRWYLEERFPAWASEIDYWRVNDVGLTPADVALNEIEALVRGLIARLSG